MFEKIKNMFSSKKPVVINDKSNVQWLTNQGKKGTERKITFLKQGVARISSKLLEESIDNKKNKTLYMRFGIPDGEQNKLYCDISERSLIDSNKVSKNGQISCPGVVKHINMEFDKKVIDSKCISEVKDEGLFKRFTITLE